MNLSVNNLHIDFFYMNEHSDVKQAGKYNGM